MGKGANTNMMNTANTQPIPRGGKGGAVPPRGVPTGAVSTSLGPTPTNPDGTPAGVQPMPTSGPFMPYTGGPAPMNPPQSSGGKGGGLQARNDFMNADNELNRIRGAQMELERKARQEALNRSYYDQPAEPTEPTPQPADIVEPAQPTPLNTMPASRNPYNRLADPRETFDMIQRERLNAAYRNRLERFNNPMGNMSEALRPYINETPLPRMETPEQRQNRLLSYISRPSSRFGPVNPNQVMNRFTGVRRAAFGEPLQISSAFGSPFSGLRALGRERFNPALVNAPVGDGPRVSAGRGGKGDYGALAPYVNI